MGEALVGPSVIVHGTPEQQAHFLPRIISGEDVYCQGFSEPDYGCDLAAVQTRGEVDGDEIVITGQKVWTSGAARATMMFVAVPHRPGRGEARRAVVRADPVHRPGRRVPADPADVRGVRVLRGLPRRRPGAAVQRDRRAEQRLAGGDDHARPRARRPGHRRSTWASSGSSGSWSTPPASTARPPTRWSASSWPGPTPASSSCGSAGCARWPRSPRAARPARRPRSPSCSGASTTSGSARSRWRSSAPTALLRPGRARLPDHALAERVPVQPGRDDLLGHQRDPAQHHRRARRSACRRSHG